MAWHVTLDEGSYEEARAAFEWELPSDYNIANDLVRKHEDQDGVALYQAYPDGRRESYTFAEIDALSNRLANAFAHLGIGRGDRVAVVLPQKPENLLTHVACWKLGAISVPLSILFGTEALAYRLDKSGAVAAVVDESVRETIDTSRPDCPALDHVIEVDGDADGQAVSFDAFVNGHEPSFELASTNPETPAIILFTSGSTGPPKGVLHAHGVWVGHCPSFYMYFERDLDGSVCWTPADWAWLGALGDLVFPAWHYGCQVVGYPMGKFDPGTAYELLETYGVTDAFIPPTAIRMMMDRDADNYDLALKAICSGGEPLTPEILEWASNELEGVAVNEIYGQTEANLLVVTCQGWFPAQAGSMGKPVPGHDVAIIDPETGEEGATGEIGEIAVRHDDDPVIFEEYWKEPEKTEAARLGDWHRTGDLGYVDDDGYYWFKSRDDDIIITSGYRVGPGEVESAILEHPNVEQVGVIGVPDDTRGEIIKAFVQPVSGVTGDEDLRSEIQQLVRDLLAKHEYPRQIEFIDELPQTTTGKIQRTALRDREGV